MKAYSLDLRQRVLAAALRGDRTIPQVAELFGVSTAFVNKMLRLHRLGDDLAPRPHGGGHTPHLQARHHKLLRAAHGECGHEHHAAHTPRLGARHHRLLRVAVAANNDATLGELRERLAARTRTEVSDSTVSRVLKALGLPRKKKHEGGGAQKL